ncbi:MAG: HDOD domain-containing protein [Gammaproteobacteria bacterium]|nr:HDOD domain-containing protein [Gammaproteobacteria bacterium]
MSEKRAPFELLKTYSGLIHRQPLFITNQLDVESYHLSFLTKHGEKLDDDTEIPKFIEQLPAILPAISERQKALLSLPESWRETLLNTDDSEINFTLDVNGNDEPTVKNSHFTFARHASLNKDSKDSSTLLIDIEEFDPKTLTEHLPTWRKRHSILCATNVNQRDEFTFCKQHDLDLLQGQFYTLPAANDNQRISPATQILMELLVKLQNPDIEASELADTINLDISLSYKLLRLINSAFFGLRKEVSSIQQAIVLLGFTKIKTWASLLSLSGVDDKPKELRIVAMTRAKMCEMLAKYYKGQADTFFAAGLFSTLDALMDKPLPSLLNNLPLSPELVNALQNHSGAAGRALQDVLNYEKGDWVALDASPLPVEVIARAYLDAIHWAKELNSQLQG